MRNTFPRVLAAAMAIALTLSIGRVPAAMAAAAPFDLDGPDLAARVTRAGTTLPIAEVPNLLPGDRIAIAADFPESQSAKYLLVVAFLRGATNPPPDEWFFQCETWKPKCRDGGLAVTVPPGAQQALVFLAPSSGNGLRTLVGAVQGRPGAFVRAAQQLNQASLDRARLEIYLQDLRRLDAASAERVREATPLLARSLAIKVNEKCLDRTPQLQIPCLMEGQETLILSDGHGASMIEALTAGPAAEVLMTAAATPQLNRGYYSPYISSVLDLARLLDPFKRANYTYVPALAFPRDARLSLRLNTPPSFQDPKSVLVAALPAIEPARPPPMRAVDPRDIFCARRASLVLPVEGAPLVFGTQYAHGLHLRLTREDGSEVQLAARPDALQGGFVVDTSPLASARLGPGVRGVLRGRWGFEDWVGPEFQLVMPPRQGWRAAGAEEDTLIVGRDGTVRVRAESVSCLRDVEVEAPGGRRLAAQWERVAPGEVVVRFPLQQVEPGALTLRLAQYGADEPQQVQVRTYAVAAQVDAFEFHEGDAQGVLKGQRLDQVTRLSAHGVEFVPAGFSRGRGNDELLMRLRDLETQSLLPKAGEPLASRASLDDGRVLALRATVLPPRPQASLVARNVSLPRGAQDPAIRVATDAGLPQGATLTFTLRASRPNVFGPDARVEVASLDGGFATTLALAQNRLKVAGPGVVVAALDPAREFGPAAFGPLRFRVASSDAIGDWQPLTTLLRVPELVELKCPAANDATCSLAGTDLYLIQSIGRGPDFTDEVQVPEGFPGSLLPVPHPGDEGLYLRLRDDPTAAHAVQLRAQAMEPQHPAG
ncbi:MAG: hypothetical protein MUF07_13095 [Steroidobacteraceae bacterium]|nr:hypothetical protein [Steroidobacteraceae bacterium]